MIQVENIHYTIGGKKILEDVSFSVNEGEIVTIIGPNGCGKSTLLKIMTRLLKPESGNVLLQNRKLTDYDPKELGRAMAILPQIKRAPEDVTVEQLVQYGRYPHTGFSGQLKKEDFEAVDQALATTGMDKFRNRVIASLSGGENQMVWITMALAQAPKILFLDEPTTYLDICYQLEVLELVKELNRKLGLTIVMVLHDINQAAAYSHRILSLHERKIYSYGETETVVNDGMFREVFSVETEPFTHNDGRTVNIPERIVNIHG